MIAKYIKSYDVITFKSTKKNLFFLFLFLILNLYYIHYLKKKQQQQHPII